MMPPTSISGMNAAIVVSDDASTGASIRRAPSRAAVSGAAPAWRLVSASSPTTIASVDDDAEGHDEGEQAHHVDAAAEPPEHPERGHERHRNSDRDPERDPRVEEQVQHCDHENQSAPAVLQQEHGPVSNQLPRLVVGRDLHARRPLGAPFVEPSVQNAGRFETVRRLCTTQQQADRRTTLDGGTDLAVSGAAFHRGDVTEGEEAPVVAGAQRQALEARLVALLIERSKLLRGLVPADAAGGKVHARGSDPAGDLAERHVELTQGRGRHLDGDLLGRKAEDLHLGDSALEQVPLDVAHDRAQVLPVATGHEQTGHRLVVDDPLDYRLLRIPGEIADRRDPLLHLVERDVHVAALFVLESDCGIPSIGSGRGRAHRVDAQQLAFDRIGDCRLHVLCRRARPLHGDGDVVDVEVREELRVQPGEGPRPDEQHDRHQQVAGDGMAREDVDEAAWSRRLGRIRGGRRGHRRFKVGNMVGKPAAPDPPDAARINPAVPRRP